MGRLIITRRGPEEGVLRVKLNGDLNDRTSSFFAETLQAACTRGIRQVRIDLASVKDVTSTGIATLVTAVEDCNCSGVQIVITDICDKAAQLLEMLGLLDMICWSGRGEEELT